MKPILLICFSDDEIPEELRFLTETQGETKPSETKPTGPQPQIQFEPRERVLAPHYFSDRHFETILFDCHLLDRSELMALLKLSEVSLGTPLLILAQQIMLSAYGGVGLIKNAVTLQKPFDQMVLTTLLERVVSKQYFVAARSPRFITNQPVNMLVLKTGLLIPTRMRNYSAGGAFLEYHGISLKVGDHIQIKVNQLGPAVRREQSQQQLKAKVIWIREGAGGSRSPTRGVGVQFLNLPPLDLTA